MSKFHLSAFAMSVVRLIATCERLVARFSLPCQFLSTPLLSREVTRRVVLAAIFIGGLLGAACDRLTANELQITELLINPRTAGDVWEWIEVRNTGTSEIDLNGYFAARYDDTALAAGAQPSIDANAIQSVVPASGLAVLYAANLTGTNNDFRDDLFRESWSLSPNAAVIGVNGFPDLTNSGTAFGFWATRADYDADLVDVGGVRRVRKFDNAAFSFDFRTATLPPEGASFRWKGTGDYQDIAQWKATAAGESGVVTSTPHFLPGTTVGSPGVVPTGAAPVGLHITEVMYNPAESQPTWEWVEVLNNTPAAIDFAATPYVLDDGDGAALTSANITSGSVAQGSVAILYNATLTPAVIQAAWDPTGARGINFIPVASFSGLNNTGDRIGLWEGLASYTSEAVTGPNRTMANAKTTLTYGSGPSGTTGNWPVSTSGHSIVLSNVGADSSVGGNWALSSQGTAGAFLVASSVALYAGGDRGEPGVFSAEGAPGDFDRDQDVDGADLALWHDSFGVNSGADSDGDGDSDGGDFLLWQRAFGSVTTPTTAQAVPEPASWILQLAASLIACGLWSGRSSSRGAC